MFASTRKSHTEKLIQLTDPNDAIAFALALYRAGIDLMKNNQAYSGDKYVDCGNLQSEMNSVDEFDAKNGSFIAKSPLRALFVMKITLDHMGVDEIVDYYETFKKKYMTKTMDATLIVFSQATQMFSHHAVIQMLRGYILNQLRFTEEQRKVACNEAVPLYDNYFHIVGGERGDKVKDVTDILSRNMFVSRLTMKL